MKLKDLKGKEAALQKILQNEKIESKLAYRLSKLCAKVLSEFKHIDTERTRLLDKYGKLNEKKTEYVFENGEQGKYVDEMNALMEEETKLEIEKIPFAYIDGKVELSPADFMILEEFIEEPIELKAV